MGPPDPKPRASPVRGFTLWSSNKLRLSRRGFERRQRIGVPLKDSSLGHSVEEPARVFIRCMSSPTGLSIKASQGGVSNGFKFIARI